jgi:hypothetical protein
MRTERMPSIGAIARAQLGLLIGTKFVAGMFGLIALQLFILYGAILKDAVPPWGGPKMQMFAVIQTVGAGAIAGMLVWFSEGPRHRRYHWSMPVQREIHDLMRIVAGAIWLFAATVVFCLAIWLLEDPAIRDQWLRHVPYFWATMFLVPLLAYLLLCIPCMTLGRPLYVMLLAVMAAVILSLDVVKVRAPVIADIGGAIFSETYPRSLTVAFAGGENTAPWHNAADIQRVYWQTKNDFFKKYPEKPSVREGYDHTMQKLGQPGYSLYFHGLGWMGKPTFYSRKQWVQSLVIWYALAILGIAFALRRRPDV